MTRCVVHDKRCKRGIASRYTLDIKIDCSNLSSDIPLSEKVISHYCDHAQAGFLYANFYGLGRKEKGKRLW